jgi:hypothetical protein
MRGEKNVPRRLKPALFYSIYGAAESRALSKQVSALSFSAASEVVPFPKAYPHLRHD